MGQAVSIFNKYHFNNSLDFDRMNRDFSSFDEILLLLNDNTNIEYLMHYNLLNLLFEYLLHKNADKTLSIILTNRILCDYLLVNFTKLNNNIKNLSLETLMNLLMALDDMKYLSKLNDLDFAFIRSSSPVEIKTILCSELSNLMLRYIYQACDNDEIRTDFLKTNQRKIFDKDEYRYQISQHDVGITLDSLKDPALFNMLMRKSLVELRTSATKIDGNNNTNYLEDKILDYEKDILDDIDFKKRIFKKYYPFLENDPKIDDMTYIVSPAVISELPKCKNRLEFLQEATNIKTSEVIVDYLFHDNIYNVWANIVELLRYYLSNKLFKIESSHIKFYQSILNIDSMSLNKKIEFYHKFQDKDVCTKFYEDITNAKISSYNKIACSLETLDTLCYSSRLSKEYIVYDYRYDKYFMLVRCMHAPIDFDGKNNLYDSYCLISNNDNSVTFTDGYIYGYDRINPNRVMNVHEKDAESFSFDNRLCSSSINRICLPKEPIFASDTYNEINIKNEVKDGRYVPLKPSYVICFDKINQKAIDESIRLGLPIALLKTRKLKTKDVKIFEYKSKNRKQHFDSYVDSYTNENKNSDRKTM